MKASLIPVVLRPSGTCFWFSGQWIVPSVPGIGTCFVWNTAVTVIDTRVLNNTGGSVSMAICRMRRWTHCPMRSSGPFPEAAGMTGVGILNSCFALVIGFGGFALLLIILTRGRLGLRR